MRLPVSRIAELIAATGRFDPRAIAEGYSIDSRTVQAEELFFAVKGERLDGHDFVEQALSRGVVAAVVRKDELARYALVRSEGERLLVVDDTLVALQTLATAVRKIWGKTVIGVTGSMGKTTTKEAMAHLLAIKYRVHRTKGNFNNHFGLPLGLLTLEPEYDVAVVEMGMSHSGEIAALARIAQPNEAVITNVAPVHLESFESIAGIARAKYELVEALPHGGTAVLNGDDEYVSQFGRDFKGKVVMFGFKPTADVRAENVEVLGAEGTRFDLVCREVRQPVQSPLLGRHNVYNVLAAAAVALEHGITPSEIAAAMPSLQAADKRGQVVRVGNITVLYDCYNSSPKALMAAADTLAAMPGRRRIVVAGEMLELGGPGEELHRECGRYMAVGEQDFLLGVRGLAEAMVESARAAGMKAEFVATPEEAGEWLARETRDGDVVLLKASRGVKLEKALERWRERREIAAPGQG
ncbi:MAG: UDP-N-acetylmuramoyl-tripeptide--D-alanyl-D-alanine ligase [Terriglobales bacterium]|jgi:UDP-N-acetylmuramoyl-tripeptide--D-alanyl-D-alanine ligase